METSRGDAATRKFRGGRERRGSSSVGGRRNARERRDAADARALDAPDLLEAVVEPRAPARRLARNPVAPLHRRGVAGAAQRPSGADDRGHAAEGDEEPHASCFVLGEESTTTHGRVRAPICPTKPNSSLLPRGQTRSRYARAPFFTRDRRSRSPGPIGQGPPQPQLCGTLKTEL